MSTEVLPAEDRRTLFLKSGTPPHLAKLTTSEVDEALVAIGSVRARMLPPYPPIWKLGQAVNCDRDPKWDLETDRLAGDALLHIRDERFGWRHYIFTKAEAAKMGAALTLLAAMEPPGARGSA